MALGPLFETEYLLGFCNEMKYIQNERYIEIEQLRKRVGSLLWQFYHSL
ncbi:MAG: hypothetical protein JXD21_03115 [Candidatus Omnitrophica bacterium]|nr:hypothetical protein [Candidatus Omnitrophota bacterium]